jgi:alcohol dehydrogenase
MATYEMRKFVAPEFIFGVGARRRVAHYARHLNAHRALIVTDPGVIAAGWLKDIQDDLGGAGIEYKVFQDVTPNPKDSEVMAGAQVFAVENCDFIIALGGGSVIDCAKGIGIVHANGGDISAYEGVDQIDIPPPPLICVPTTAGTSADVSQFCIVTNSPARYKMAIISKAAVPDVALVDPETTLTMPPSLTAATGMDALTHAVEAYVSTASSPVVDVHALAAIRLVWNNLEAAVTTPDDLAARENMMLASLQAGLAFSNASLGAVHAMAHSLGGYLDLPHGECNSLLLEHVVRYNMDAASDRYVQVGEAMGLDMRGMGEKERTRSITGAIQGLRLKVGIAGGLSDRGVRSADISELAVHAIKDACLVTNPRKANLGDIIAIYGDAI